MYIIISVFYEQRDPMLEQYETIAGIFIERTLPNRHKCLYVQYERRSNQSIQPGDPRIVGGGR